MRSRNRFRSVVAMATVFLMVFASVAMASDLDTSLIDIDTNAPVTGYTLEAGESRDFTIKMTITGRQTNPASFVIDQDYTVTGGVVEGSNPDTISVPARESTDDATVITRTGKMSVASGEPDGGPYTVKVTPRAVVTTSPAALAVKSLDDFPVRVNTTVVVDPCASVAAPAAPTFVHSPDGSGGWYKTIPTVSASSSGATVSYSLASGGPYGAAPALGQGETTVYAIATGTDTCAKTSSESSQTYKVDTVAPSITDNGVTAGTSGNNGWYTSAVTNRFTATDATSGIPTTFTNPFTKSSGTVEGAAVKIASGSVSDVAGNVNNGIDSAAFKIDMTPPTSVVTGVTSNSYVLGSEPTPACLATDQSGLSGVATHGSATVSGGSGVGQKSVTCNGATDNAGNTQTVASNAATYNVVYAFGGWQEPVKSLPIRNTVKAGRAIPIKFSLGGDQGLAVFNGTGPKVSSFSCTAAPTDPVEDTSLAGSSSLQYDALTDTYTYVWKSDTKWANSCMRLGLNLKDGSTHHIDFQFTK